jgi:hypothetical protein
MEGATHLERCSFRHVPDSDGVVLGVGDNEVLLPAVEDDTGDVVHVSSQRVQHPSLRVCKHGNIQNAPPAFRSFSTLNSQHSFSGFHMPLQSPHPSKTTTRMALDLDSNTQTSCEVHRCSRCHGTGTATETKRKDERIRREKDMEKCTNRDGKKIWKSAPIGRENGMEKCKNQERERYGKEHESGGEKIWRSARFRRENQS